MSQQIDSPARLDREQSLQELIARIARGEEAALGDLYDQAQSPIYALILRIVSLPHVAEEVTMDVFLQVWRQAAQYQECRGSALAWLLMLARSRALDRLRREQRNPVHQGMDFSDGFDVVDLGESPFSLAQVKQIKTRVTAAFQELPSDLQRVIQLSFYEGLSHVEIAEQLQLPLGTVKTRIRSAIGKFRQVLA